MGNHANVERLSVLLLAEAVKRAETAGVFVFLFLFFSPEMWVKGRVISSGITQDERTLHLSQTMDGSSAARYIINVSV